MKSICIIFQVHQPFRLRTYRFFDIGHKHDYFDDYSNRFAMLNAAEKSYLPANALLLELIERHGKKLKISFSISGTALEQFLKYTPDVLTGFQALAKTGCVEFLAETYSHSLASLKSPSEFERQVKKHQRKIEELFGMKPTTFSNTELIYSDAIGEMVYNLGFRTMITEGAKHVLGWKSPNFLYCSAVQPKLKLMLRSFQLSDDISFRFSEQRWSEWPLTADKFAGWINALKPNEELVNLFLNYETLGQNQWAETGIFEFLSAFVSKIIKEGKHRFYTPTEISSKHQPISGLHVPYPISWTDEERDLTTWLGNELQKEAFDKLFNIGEIVRNCANPDIFSDWEKLQSSDHLNYMSTKWFSDGIVGQKNNPYNSPYDAFINYMNVVSDLNVRLDKLNHTIGSKERNAEESAKSKSSPTSKKIGKKAEKPLKKPVKTASSSKAPKA
ncbi:MAG TPA: glycoside hydrolase family 57 protein [Bacteroidales bacterium]|nr:glycoside hydrolase family 57 protein [Bacteroidales bacterium]